MGGVDGDRGRNARGNMYKASNTLSSVGVVDGVFSSSGSDGRGESDHSNVGAGNSVMQVILDLERVMPTGPAFVPRRWGALACCYLGQPSS